jgi:DNA-binding SARP family transcriptional activator
VVASQADRGLLVDYRLLGPLQVCRDGSDVPLGGDRQRVLLALLLLHANEVVSADVLIDGLWGERPPPSALNALHVKVSRLRRALGVNGDRQSDGVLTTRGRGYLLRVKPGDVDVDRFRGLLEQGRGQLAAGEVKQAAGTLRSALGMWRGPRWLISATSRSRKRRSPSLRSCGWRPWRSDSRRTSRWVLTAS